MEKFPDHVDVPFPKSNTNGIVQGLGVQGQSSSPSRSPLRQEYTNGDSTDQQDRWMPIGKKENSHSAMWSAANRSHGHRRQKSLTDAFRNIRARNGSVSQNAHEIADALKAPVSPKLIVCLPFMSIIVFEVSHLNAYLFFL